MSEWIVVANGSARVIGVRDHEFYPCSMFECRYFVRWGGAHKRPYHQAPENGDRFKLNFGTPQNKLNVQYKSKLQKFMNESTEEAPRTHAYFNLIKFHEL